MVKSVFIQICLMAYIVVAVVTFGHVLNNKAAGDLAKELSAFTSMVWPLYWSWELQRNQ